MGCVALQELTASKGQFKVQAGVKECDFVQDRPKRRVLFRAFLGCPARVDCFSVVRFVVEVLRDAGDLKRCRLIGAHIRDERIRVSVVWITPAERIEVGSFKTGQWFAVQSKIDIRADSGCGQEFNGFVHKWVTTQ